MTLFIFKLKKTVKKKGILNNYNFKKVKNIYVKELFM